MHWKESSKGEYGDIGLTPDVHILLVRELKKLADEVTQGRFVIVLCGGSRRDLAHYLIPKIIEVLAEVELPKHRGCVVIGSRGGRGSRVPNL